MFAAQLRDAFHDWLMEHKPTYEESRQPKVSATRSKEEIIVMSGEFLHIFSFYDGNSIIRYGTGKDICREGYDINKGKRSSRGFSGECIL